MATTNAQTKEKKSDDPFKEFYWMENVEDYDKECEKELEQEEEMVEELEEMLDEEENIRQAELTKALQKEVPSASNDDQTEVGGAPKGDVMSYVERFTRLFLRLIRVTLRPRRLSLMEKNSSVIKKGVLPIVFSPLAAKYVLVWAL